MLSAWRGAGLRPFGISGANSKKSCATQEIAPDQVVNSRRLLRRACRERSRVGLRAVVVGSAQRGKRRSDLCARSSAVFPAAPMISSSKAKSTARGFPVAVAAPALA